MADEPTNAEVGGELFDAVMELLYAPNSREETRAVITRRPELLTDAGLAEMDRVIATLAAGGNDEYHILHAYQADLLRRCRADGVAKTLAGLDDAASATLLHVLLTEATSAPSTRRLVKGRRILLRDSSIAELEQLIRVGHEVEDPRALEWDHLPWLLRTCRQVGIDAAIPMKLLQPGAYTVRRGRWAMLRLQQRMQRAIALVHASGRPDTLDASIEEWTRLPHGEVFQRADPTAQAVMLSNAALLLSLRAELTGSADDLRRSLAFTAHAMGLAPRGSRAFLMAAQNRVAAACGLYEQTGEEALVREAIEAGEAAVQTSAAEPTLVGQAHIALGLALSTGFSATGDVEDLARAERVLRDGLRMTAPWWEQWPRALIVFARLRLVQGINLGDLDAVGQAAIAMRLVLGRTTPGSLYHLQARLLLGVALHGLSLRDPDARPIDEAIGHLEVAAAGLPGGPVGLTAHADLAYALNSRYLTHRDPADLNRAIELWEELLPDLPDGSPLRAMIVGDFGSALVERHKLQGRPDDLEAGITHLRQAIAVSHDAAPILDKLYHDLGLGLQALSEARHDDAAADEAEQAYRAACIRGLQTGSHEVAISTAREWSEWATRRGAWAQAAEACGYALDAAASLVRGQSARQHQESWLYEIKGLAARGAYALAKAGDLEGAVMLLEHGRTLLLSDLLDLDRRRTMAIRAAGWADLHDRLIAALERLDLASATALLPTSTDLAVSRPPVGAARAELDAVVTEIRRIPGFEDFLKPPSFDDVTAAARDAPLAYLVITTVGGLALIVGAGPGVRPCWLPDLTDDATVAHFGRIDEVDHTDEMAAFGKMMRTLCRWLWDAAMGPLLASLGPTRHLVLIATGPLARLPLHAAWTEDPSAPSGRRYALDAAAITYTPSAKTILARPRPPGAVEDALIVQDPRPARAHPLPHTIPEAKAVAAAFPQSRTLRHQAATRTGVLGLLSGCSVAHFACHGFTDWATPLNSGLIMANDEVLTLRDLFGLKLVTTRLMTLSACESGVIGGRIPDEAVSLPTGLLAAGVPAVVASLWPVLDEATAFLMRRFYYLWLSEHLDPHEALRQAQRWLRDVTNAEVAAAFPDVATPSPPAGLSHAAQAFWEGARPYSDLSMWAAFTYTGA